MTCGEPGCERWALPPEYDHVRDGVRTPHCTRHYLQRIDEAKAASKRRFEAHIAGLTRRKLQALLDRINEQSTNEREPS